MATRKEAAPTRSTAARKDAVTELRSLRKSIDNLDCALFCLLAERFQITQKVGVLKAEHGIPAVDPEREAAQKDRTRALSAKAGLDPIFAEQLLHFILKDVVRKHRAIAKRYRAPVADA